jgi:hypothetical protein
VEPVIQERAGRRAGRAEGRAGAARPGQAEQAAGQRARRTPAHGRRYQIAGVLIAVVALSIAGVLTIALSGHTARGAATANSGAGPGPPGAAVAVRDQAAAWVAGQVSRTAVVSCDPGMCQALQSHGVPASDLYRLGPQTTSPLASAVVVATALVRAQFGNLLTAVYAPAVIARFGSGQGEIDIREVAQHGAAAYRSALHADLLERQASGAGLLASNRIAASAIARRQLSAGQVDARLIITIAGMAAVHPLEIVAFGSSAPGGDASEPLRFAEVTQLSAHHAAARSASPAFVRSMTGFVRGQPAHLGTVQTQAVRVTGGQTVLRIEFGAPSPLGLLGPHSP